MIFILFALSLCLISAPASAQGFVTPTPLPAIVATQQSAAQQLSSVQAANAQADQLDAQAAEIRRNADAQAQQAAQAYADARAATAAQNAAAIGEAIGRGEAILGQIKASLDGALKINDDRAAIINSLYISMTQQGAELNQAQIELTNLKAVNASLQKNNETLAAQNKSNTTSANVLSVLPGFLAFMFLLGLIVLIIRLRELRNATSSAATVTAAQSETEEPTIEGEYTT